MPHLFLVHNNYTYIYIYKHTHANTGTTPCPAILFLRCAHIHTHAYTNTSPFSCRIIATITYIHTQYIHTHVCMTSRALDSKWNRRCYMCVCMSLTALSLPSHTYANISPVSRQIITTITYIRKYRTCLPPHYYYFQSSSCALRLRAKKWREEVRCGAHLFLHSFRRSFPCCTDLPKLR